MAETWRVSPWLSEVDAPAPQLLGEADADVVIVGAGYTGLSAALELCKAGLSVVVLESELAGFGASGRNAGHLTPTIGKDLPTLARLFGRERTQALVRLAETAVSYTEERIRQHGIECDHEPVGNVFAAVHEKQFAAIDRAARAAAEIGMRAVVLEQSEMRQRGVARPFLRGLLESTGGLLNPGKYVRGLRRAALAAGAVLFERTPVTQLEATERVVAHTPSGRVRAQRAIVATNAYTAGLGFPVPNVARVYVQLFKTAPLTKDQLEALGWHGRQGIYTAHESLESYRLTADNSLVGGAKYVRYGYGGRALADVDDSVAAHLEAVFRARFPELAGVAVEQHWGGPIAFTLDFLPLVGRAGRHQNVFYSLAYAGHGIAQATYAGRMVTELTLGQDGPGAVLWGRRQPPFPPEPFRWIVARSLIGVFGMIDARIDRAVARRRASPLPP